MLQVMRSWDLTMRGELDYRQEAENLREVLTCPLVVLLCSSGTTVCILSAVSIVLSLCF